MNNRVSESKVQSLPSLSQWLKAQEKEAVGVMHSHNSKAAADAEREYSLDRLNPLHIAH
jgi:hypothetical protein